MQHEKIFLITTVIFSTLLFGQELSKEMKYMISYDNIGNFSEIVNKDNINKCYSVKESTYSLLLLAIKMQKKELFNKLIEEKADLNLICDHKTPLMYAAKYGEIQFAILLLKAGANKTIKTDNGLTALDYAKKYNKPEITELLK